MALSPSPQPMSRTSPWTKPPLCQPITFSLGALVSQGGVGIGGMPSPGLSPRYSASKSIRCNPEGKPEESEPVISASLGGVQVGECHGDPGLHLTDEHFGRPGRWWRARAVAHLGGRGEFRCVPAGFVQGGGDAPAGCFLGVVAAFAHSEAVSRGGRTAAMTRLRVVA